VLTMSLFSRCSLDSPTAQRDGIFFFFRGEDLLLERAWTPRRFLPSCLRVRPYPWVRSHFESLLDEPFGFRPPLHLIGSFPSRGPPSLDLSKCFLVMKDASVSTSGDKASTPSFLDSVVESSFLGLCSSSPRAFRAVWVLPLYTLSRPFLTWEAVHPVLLLYISLILDLSFFRRESFSSLGSACIFGFF